MSRGVPSGLSNQQKYVCVQLGRLLSVMLWSVVFVVVDVAAVCVGLAGVSGYVVIGCGRWVHRRRSRKHDELVQSREKFPRSGSEVADIVITVTQ